MSYQFNKGDRVTEKSPVSGITHGTVEEVLEKPDARPAGTYLRVLLDNGNTVEVFADSMTTDRHKP